MKAKIEKAESRRQKPDGGRQKAEGRMRKAKGGRLRASVAGAGQTGSIIARRLLGFRGRSLTGFRAQSLICCLLISAFCLSPSGFPAFASPGPMQKTEDKSAVAAASFPK